MVEIEKILSVVNTALTALYTKATHLLAGWTFREKGPSVLKDENYKGQTFEKKDKINIFGILDDSLYLVWKKNKFLNL